MIGITTLSADVTPKQNGAGVGTQSQNGAGNGYRNYGGNQAALENKAQIFGMTVDELKQALQNKTMSQIAVEKGLSQEEFQAKMQAAAEEHWQARGLSDEEIAKRKTERTERQAENQENCDGFGSGTGNHRGGFGQNR